MASLLAGTRACCHNCARFANHDHPPIDYVTRRLIEKFDAKWLKWIPVDFALQAAVGHRGHNRYNHGMNVVTVNPKVQGGVPCFAGTRVPVGSLFDHLKRGYTVAQFIEDFPTVTQAQAEAVLEAAKSEIIRHAEHVTVG